MGRKTTPWIGVVEAGISNNKLGTYRGARVTAAGSVYDGIGCFKTGEFVYIGQPTPPPAESVKYADAARPVGKLWGPGMQNPMKGSTGANFRATAGFVGSTRGDTPDARVSSGAWGGRGASAPPATVRQIDLSTPPKGRWCAGCKQRFAPEIRHDVVACLLAG